MTTRNNLLRLLTVLLSLLLCIQLPVTVMAAENEAVGTAWVTLEDTGRMVNPETGDITGEFSLGLPDGMVYTDDYELCIFWVIDFQFDKQAQRFRASWVKGSGDYGWAYEFIRDHYPFYQEDPELLAKASYANQREVWDALAVELLGWATIMETFGFAAPGTVTNGAFLSEPTWFYYPNISKGESQAVFTNVPIGQYLCLTSSAYDPQTKQFANNPVSVAILPQAEADGNWYLRNAQVSLKGANIGLSRTVDQDQVGIGDTVTFGLNIRVPKYQYSTEGNAGGDDHTVEYTGERDFTLTDVLAPGFTLLEATIQVEDGLPPGAYTQKISKEPDGQTQITWDFHYEYLRNISSIHLTYQAKVNDHMAVGSDDNTAAATLTYVKNIGGEAGILTDSVRLWTYGMTIVKANGNTLNSGELTDAQGNVTGTHHVATSSTEYLAGAVFQLSKQIGTYPATSQEELTANREYMSAVFANQEKGQLYTLPIYKKNDGVTVEGYGLYLSIQESLITEASSVGITLSGLDTGTYLLVETLAPQGYNRLSQGIRFTIPETPLQDGEYYGKRDSQKTFTDAYGQESPSGNYELLVANYQGIQLPESGGIGTAGFTCTGLLMMAAAIFVFLRAYTLKNNKSKEID